MNHDDYSLDDTQPKPPVVPDIPATPQPDTLSSIDTQPKNPLKQRPVVDVPQQHAYITPQDEEPASGGPGCAMWGCVGAIGLALAVAIVVMAAAAGWTAGRREADAFATSTQGATINEQLSRIPGDLANGNLQLVDTRLRFLATIAPDAPGLADFASTATEAFLQRLPTETPTPSPTLEVTATLEETDDFVITPADEGPTYDLAAMLEEASRDVTAGQFEDGYDLLDVIMAVDENYERQRVRQLLETALNGQARAMFNAGNSAQGVIWATRAEDLGVLQGDVSFEMNAAIMWQSAQSAMGLSYPQAVNALQRVVDLGPGRYYDQARQALFQQYVRWGDALVTDPAQGYCPAVPQYQNAVNVINDPAAVAKRDQASSMCAQATPTLGPGMTPNPEQTPGAPPPNGQIAPVGQPGT